ncbi:MAG: hypothetical protein AAF934_11570, partial [Bacteroidota bacterium]
SKMIYYSKLKAYFLGCFVLFMVNIYGQEVNIDAIPTLLKKNAVYGSIGYLVYYGFYNINVERTLWDTNGIITNIRARLGGGEWARGGWGGSEGGTHFIGTLSALTGYRTFHFELNIGAVYLHDKINNKNFIYPASALGIRLQKPGEPYVFRFGIGFPEAIYLSLGIAF